MHTVREQLLLYADETYKRFQCSLMPTVDPARVIGVRTPVLRRLAKELTVSQKERLLSELPHRYYEEDNLHAFVIERMLDAKSCIAEIDRFLPYVDNWATCDMMRPLVFKKHPETVLRKSEEWMTSSHPYTVRYGIEMWMLHGLDAHFDKRMLEYVAAIESEEYYVKMMVAWYFATALAKRFGDAVEVLECHRLSPWIHQKTIQKARESRVVTPEQKQYLKTLSDRKVEL